MRRNLLMFFLFCCATLATAFGQNITVTGTVIDENDEPVIGATIRLKSDESKGTVTDIDGHFTIQTTSGQTLLVSYVGYKTQEVKATKSLTIKLVPDQETLDEVMVVAYGTAKKESLTGSIAVVDAEDLNKRIQGNAIGSLEGAASGVQVNNTYGEPGKAPKIRIRGIGTLGTSSPLYVVDGVPYSGDLSEINPSDIKSFSILKDAASTALYGSRASNGVVLITTKNGSAIKNDPTITFTSNIGAYTRGLPEYDRLDPTKWMEASWIALKNFAMNGEQKLSAKDAATYATQHLIADYAKRNIFDKADDQLFDEKGKFLGKLLPGYDDLDWAKAFEKVGLRQDYNISGSYATDKMSIYSSLGYLKEEGYVVASDYERFTARANGTYTPVKWIKLGTNVNASYTNRNYNTNASGNAFLNPFYNARYMAPIYPYYMHKADGSYELDENGEKVWDTTSPYLSNRNIGYELRNDIQNTKMRSLGIQGYADIILPYGFTATVRGDMNERVENYMQFNNPNIGDGAANNGRFREGSTSYSTYTFQQLLNWKNTFADRHNIEVLLGHENYSYKKSDFYGMNENMAIGGIIVMKNFLQNNYFEGFDDNYRTESYFSRLKYDYDNRYIVEGSFRRDGSSRFAPDKRWGNFFSIGGSWNISSEEFMQDVDWVDFLKLRASYGEVGNDASIGYYGYMALYTIDKNGGEAALIKKSLPTPDIKWETSQTVDVALEGRL